MINAYEVAIKLKAEDHFSDAMKKMIKYLGDATEKSTKLESKLEKVVKLVKTFQGMDGKGTGSLIKYIGEATQKTIKFENKLEQVIKLVKTLQGMSGKGSGLTKWLDDTSKKISNLAQQIKQLNSLRVGGKSGKSSKGAKSKSTPSRSKKPPKAKAGPSNVQTKAKRKKTKKTPLQAVTDAKLSTNEAQKAAVAPRKKTKGKKEKKTPLEAVTDAKLPTDKTQKAAMAAHKRAEEKAKKANEASHHAEKPAAKHGGAAKHGKGKGGKMMGGIADVAGMGDTAASLEKLSKTLEGFSQKAEQVSKIATQVGDFSKKMEGLAKNAGFDGVSKAMGKVGQWMDGLAGKADKVSGITKTLSKVTGSLSEFAENVNGGTFSKISSGLGKLKNAFSEASPLLKSVGSSAGKFLEDASKKASSIASDVLAKAGSLKNMAIANKSTLLKGLKVAGTRALTALGPVGDAAYAVMDAYKAATTGESDSYDFVNGIGAAITGNKDFRLGGMGDDAADHERKYKAQLYKDHPELAEGRHPTVRPGAGQTVQVKTELHVDGKKMAETVTHHQTRAANRPTGGTTRYDGHRGQRPAGATGH